MSQNQIARYLVTYDIADHRRLNRLFKLLKKHGLPVQYSVFLVTTTAAKMGSLIVNISKIIDGKEDDVRAYRLPDNGWQVSIGVGILPNDVLPGGIR